MAYEKRYAKVCIGNVYGPLIPGSDASLSDYLASITVYGWMVGKEDEESTVIAVVSLMNNRDIGVSYNDGFPYKDEGVYTAVKKAELILQNLKTTEKRSYKVIEVCPHCENEITMMWNVKAHGYKAFCPVCGKRLMLCDLCQHRGPNYNCEDCDYNSITDSCRFSDGTIGTTTSDTNN